jgi:hypothetical protein
LESCFPYALLRNAYHAVYKSDGGSVIIWIEWPLMKT